jgi:hypothetical protein
MVMITAHPRPAAKPPAATSSATKTSEMAYKNIQMADICISPKFPQTKQSCNSPLRKETSMFILHHPT